MSDLIIGKGKLAGKGVYANRDFKKGEVVTWYNLKLLTEEEYKNSQEVKRDLHVAIWGKSFSI